MKYWLLLAILFLSTVSAHAVDVTEAQRAAFGVPELEAVIPAEAKTYLSQNANPTPSGMWDSLKALFSDALQRNFGAWKKALKNAMTAFLIVVFCDALQKWLPEKAQLPIQIAGACGVTLCCAGDLRTMIGLGQKTIREFSDFSKALIPAMASAAAASGSVSGSAAILSATTVLGDLMITFQQSVLVPLMGIFVAASAGTAAVGDRTLKGFSKGIAGFVKHALKIILFVFTGYLSLSGIISGSVDAMALKAVKMTVSTTVPVVGGMLSDASETVLVSAGMLKNSMGIAGVIAVFAIGMAPFVRLGIQYLALRLGAFFSTMLSGGSLGDLMDALASAMGYLLGMTGTCGVLLLVSCVCLMKLVTP